MVKLFLFLILILILFYTLKIFFDFPEDKYARLKETDLCVQNIRLGVYVQDRLIIEFRINWY